MGSPQSPISSSSHGIEIPISNLFTIQTDPTKSISLPIPKPLFNQQTSENYSKNILFFSF